MTLEALTSGIVAFVHANQSMAAPIVFALAFGESLAFISLLLPATVILVGISALMGASGIPFLPLWIAATLGSALGYFLSYWVGFLYKDEIRGFWPFRKHPDMLVRGEAFFAKYGAIGVFLGHLSGPIRAVIPVVAGMLAMKQLPFQIANITSSAVWSAGVLSPNLLAAHWSSLQPYLGPVGRLFGE